MTHYERRNQLHVRRSLPRVWNTLEGFQSLRTVTSKTRLLSRGELPQRVGLLTSGIIKRTTSAGGDPDRIAGLHSGGYWVGAVSAILGMVTAYDFTTLTECQIVYFSLDEFRTLVYTEPSVLRNLCVSLSEQLLLTRCKEAKDLKQERHG